MDVDVSSCMGSRDVATVLHLCPSVNGVRPAVLSVDAPILSSRIVFVNK